MAKREPVIIVGGGPAGLAVAVHLALQQVDVLVLEACLLYTSRCV